MKLYLNYGDRVLVYDTETEEVSILPATAFVCTHCNWAGIDAKVMWMVHSENVYGCPRCGYVVGKLEQGAVL